MGKKGGRGRQRGGGGGGGGGSGSFRGGGGFSSSIIDPALLARHAAASSAPSAEKNTGKNAKSPGSGPKKKKGKKRRRDGGSGSVGPNGSRAEGDGPLVDSNARSSEKDRTKKKRRGVGKGIDKEDGRENPGEECGETPRSIGVDGCAGDVDDATAIHPFGHPRWRRAEQLCRVLLFPPPLSGVADPDGGSDRGIGPPSRSAPSVRLVFVSDPERSRSLASTYKPALHPAPSFAVHGKLKRDQLRAAVSQIAAPPAPGAGSNGNASTASASSIGGPALFVSDESIDRLLSALKEVRRLSVTKKKTSGGNRSAGEAADGLVVVAHYDAPKSKAVLDLRRRAAHFVARDLGDAAGRNRERCVEIRLDGTHDVDGGKARSGAKWADVLPNARSVKSLRDGIPPSDRNASQAIVNASAKMMDSGDHPERKKAAHGKLLAHLAVLRARLEKEGCQAPDGKIGPDGAAKAESAGGAGEIAKKMKILGMIADDSARGLVARKGGREVAMTRWLDSADGRKFGGSWKGPVRTGASAEPATRELAALLDNIKNENVHSVVQSDSRKRIAGESWSGPLCGDCKPHGEGTVWIALRSWRPNPSNGASQNSALDGSDEDRDSGRAADEDRRDFGDRPMAKSCGHNETAMFFLRPFAPLEVLNSRVCSHTSPAPGNAGYEGCLEFLRRMCAAAGRGITYWDTECFAYVDGRATRKKNGKAGRKGKLKDIAPVLKLEKRDLLHLSAHQIAWLMDTLRQWTLFRETTGNCVGCSPRLLILGISLVLRLAVRQDTQCSDYDESQRVSSSLIKENWKRNDSQREDLSLASLPSKVRSRIIGFILPGNPLEWRGLNPIWLK
mmetsp:Transcript_24837/g.72749  ORF Transcript_24837/g.72749 Transcript_24837/m.72749 type:complete len:843 (-) Transcript_24837:257-2785(-)